MIFHVSPWFISYRTSKYLTFLGFFRISGKNGSIFAKNRSQSLKWQYLKNTFLNRPWERNMLESWNLAKLWAKMVEKTCTVRIFIFGLILKKMDYVCFKIDFILENVRFPPYPAVLKHEYLELGIEFWHSVKIVDFVLKSSFIWTQLNFWPCPLTLLCV